MRRYAQAEAMLDGLLTPLSQTVASRVLALLAPLLCEAPYCVVAHSVGTWIAFEMLSQVREQGLPLPAKVFFSCFPSPIIPMNERPWKARRPACMRRCG